MDTEAIPIHQRRPVQQQELLVVNSFSAVSNRILRRINKPCIVTCIFDLLPFITWMRNYNIRTDLPRDILAGITVTFLQIPQSMAYAYLANVPPNVGIFTAIFPTIMYFIFGSSSYVNIGNFSITSLILGKCIAQYANVDDDGNMLNNIHSEEQITRVEVLTAITFTVMIFHLIMYITKVGKLCSLLSPTLVNAFTTGCTIHLIITQIADLVGANHNKVSGYFRNGYVLYNLVLAIPKANYITAIMGLTVVITLCAYNIFLRSKWRKRSKIPLPTELTVLCIIICISYFMDLSGKYNIKIIGKIPTGLPEIRIPKFSLMKWLVLDSFQIAIVSYIITMSMEMTIAKLVSCEVRTNHELLAMGLCNLMGSFFSCMPIAASMSRSMVQYDAGAVSQIASLISSTLMLIVVMWIAPVFQYLPMCILAAIIIVAVKPLLLQALQFPRIWKMSKMNGIIWLITFLTVVVVDIGIGLLTGIATSIVVICIQCFRPNSCILGVVPDTEIYLNVAIYKEAKEIEGIKIFHYRGGINFATAGMYKSDMVRKVGIDAKRIIDKRPRLYESPSTIQLTTPIKCIILDLAASNFIDPDGVSKLNEIQEEFAVFNIPVLLSNVSAKLYEVIQICEKYNQELQLLMIFPSIHDAVLYAKENILP